MTVSSKTTVSRLWGTGEPAALSREHVLCASEMPTFQRIVKKKCQSWSQKKKLNEALKALRARFADCDRKLMNREPLTPDDQELFDMGSGDDIDAKLKWLLAASKEMVDSGSLTPSEKTQALAQMDARLAALGEAGGAKALAQQAKVRENRDALEKRSLTWTPPKLEHDAAIRALQKQLAPLAALEKEAKSGKLLSLANAAKLGEMPDLEDRIASLEEASRGWYETDEALAARAQPLRANLAELKRKAGAAAPKKSAANDGWSTAGSKSTSKARSSNKPSRAQAKAGGAFAALGDF